MDSINNFKTETFMLYMSTIDTSVVKIEDHNVAYNSETKELKLGPVAKVKVDDEYVLAVSLHKWTYEHQPNKGCYIAFLLIRNTEKAIDVLNDFQAKFSQTNTIIDEIENGIYDTNIAVFRFSVNVWRPVSKKKTKWVFADKVKPSKDEPSYIQRVLQA